MLKVQKYLQKHTLAQLEEKYAIRITEHDSLPLVILNYTNESRKTNPIVMECRGLVLEKDTWTLVAKSFNRFFNWGEVQTERSKFNWDDCVVQKKLDGSLGLLYYYDNQWRFNTRKSFGDGKINYTDKTWIEVCCQALNIKNLNDLDDISQLSRNYTYVFELCSPYNQIVEQYDTPTATLLSIFDNIGGQELSYQDYDKQWTNIVRYTNLLFFTPVVYHCNTVEEVINLVQNISEKHPTFEGVVIRDDHNKRWKIKSDTYLALHRMRGNNDDIFNPKHQLKFILDGRTEEVIDYFPFIRDSILDTQRQITRAKYYLNHVWQQNWQIKDQKEFALTILEELDFIHLRPLSYILFEMRKRYGENQTQSQLDDIWKKSEELIYKTVFKK